MKFRRAPSSLPPWRPSDWLTKALIAAGVGTYLLLMYKLVVATQDKARPPGAAVFEKEEALPMPRAEAQRPTPGEISSLEMIPLLPMVEARKPPPSEPHPPEEPPEEPAEEPAEDSSSGDERPDWAKADPAPEAGAGMTPARRTLTPKGPPAENTSKATTAAFLSNPKDRKVAEAEEKAAPTPAVTTAPKGGKKPRQFRDMLGNADDR